MAGSYNHIVTGDGKLLNFHEFREMIEDTGDAYEMAQELFGMVWFLAGNASALAGGTHPAHLVETARQNYKLGIELHSPGIQNEQKIF